MLEVARELASEVKWRHGFAESLPFPDACFDGVVSQFGLMFVSDRERAIREMIRVLVPHGRLTVAVWDSLEHQPAYAAEVALSSSQHWSRPSRRCVNFCSPTEW